MEGKLPKADKKAGIATRQHKWEIVDLAELKASWFIRLTKREIKNFKELAAKPKIGRGLNRQRIRVAQVRFSPHTRAGRSIDGPKLER